MVELSCNKIQRLFAAVVEVWVGETAYRLRWSRWRRQHQAHARVGHYRRHRPATMKITDLRLEYSWSVSEVV